MNPLNPIFSIIIYAIAYLTAYGIVFAFKLNFPERRYNTVDGMRGFLALGVFVHHACLWYQYLQIGRWQFSESNLYNHFGSTTVSIFFMITSFLFTSKLLQSRQKEFDWKQFFISRWYRLAPMYYLSAVAVLFIVMVISEWNMIVTLPEFANEIFHWTAFTAFDYPRINGFGQTGIVNAFVIWSLPIEWLFYFSLPLLSLFILKKKPRASYLIAGILFGIAFTICNGIKAFASLSFLCGMAAAFLSQSAKAINIAKTKYAAVLVLLILISMIRLNPETIACKLLVGFVFAAVALGNSIFGLLNNRILKFLGEISYSTYLLHGIILFVVFYFGYGLENAKSLSPENYCISIFLITPIVVAASFLTFYRIEKPFMNKAKKINRQH